MSADSPFEWSLRVEMEDGSLWDVPVSVIANNRASNYAGEFGGDVVQSLVEDTLPLFADDEYEIKEWAANNMNWDDVKHAAVCVDTIHVEPDYQDGWINGPKKVIGGR